MGNGKAIKFWYDIWIGNTALKYRWPNLYSLEKSKLCSVFDQLRRVDNNLRFFPEWRKGISSVAEISEMQVSYLLVNVSFTGSDDTWNWKTDTRQPFSVADVKTLIKEGTEQPSNYKMKWETWVPGKVNLFVWRTEMERIPTKIVLRSRNIDMPDVTCVLCDVEDEDVMHLFTGCGFSFGVWSAVGNWCKIGPIFAFDFEDLLNLHHHIPANKRGKRTVKGIVMITCWAIWRARNAKVFQAKEPKVTEVVYSIKSWSYLWLKNRTRFCSILWKDWAINPLYML
ncbi:uncharacterized protein LOC110902551 [Helianthus annuus]|uniref:uncharacterized protein LOC110902551 n=1 Tax=Helianthus annuus TaxID=4232 RepID=UPI001652D886|nr:uncharacterized protein LOC110902551 [Helianthus annuus]